MYLKPCSANQCLLQSVLCMTRHNFHAIFFNILYITILLVPSQVLLAQQGFHLTGIPFWLVIDFQKSVSRFYPSVKGNSACIA